MIQETDTQDTEQDMISNKVKNNRNLTEDIAILETVYAKEKNSNVLKTLIEKLTQNYEFGKANSYLEEILADPNYNNNIQPTLHLYILLHNPNFISITDTDSIQKLLPIMNGYKSKGLLSTDDYNFYKGLIKLRYKDYE